MSNSSSTGLGFIAHSLLGRPVAVEFIPAGGLSYTNGLCLFIDSGLDMSARRDAVIFQALLLASGSLDACYIKRLRGRPRATRNYLFLEAARLLHNPPHRLPHVFADRYSLEIIPPSCSENALLQALKSTGEPGLPQVFGRIRPGPLLKYSGELPAGKGALSESERRGQFTPQNFDDSEDDDLPEDNFSLLKLLSNPLSSGGVFAKMFEDILGLKRSGEGGENSDNSSGGTPVSGARKVLKIGSNVVEYLGQEEGHPDLKISDMTTLYSYPEWDRYKGSYKADWAKVVELDPPEIQDAVPLRADWRKVARYLHPLGLEYKITSRQPRGDDIDLQNLIDYIIQVKAGQSPDENIYRRNQKSRRDMSIALLVDLSESTGDICANGESVFSRQMTFALSLLEAFDKLAVPVLAYGFHSWGRHHVQMMKIRHLNSKGSYHARKCCERLQPAGFTRMGAAIRHSCHQLSRLSQTKRNVMLVISDGFPYDEGYEGDYAAADTMQALREVREANIAPVCVSIGTEQSDDSLLQIFGATSFIRMDNVPAALSRFQKAVQYELARVLRG